MTFISASVLMMVLQFLGTAAPTAGSYESLKGKRLTRFEKTRGGSELGNLVSLNLPTSVIDRKRLKRFGKGRRFVGFEHKKVFYYVERNDPYLRQCLRKVAKNKKGKLLIKGQVKRLRARGGKKRYGVRIRSMQKYGKSTRKKSKRG